MGTLSEPFEPPRYGGIGSGFQHAGLGRHFPDGEIGVRRYLIAAISGVTVLTRNGSSGAVVPKAVSNAGSVEGHGSRHAGGYFPLSRIPFSDVGIASHVGAEVGVHYRANVRDGTFARFIRRSESVV